MHKLQDKSISTGIGVDDRQAETRAKKRAEEFVKKYDYLETTDHPRLFAEYLEMWWKMQEGKVEQTTYETYDTYFGRHLIPYFRECGMTIQDLTTRDIMEYVDHLSRAGSRKDWKKDRGLSRASIKKMLSLLRKVLCFAVQSGDISVNPAREVTIPKDRGDHEETHVFLSLDEARDMLYALRDEPICPLVMVTLYYGLRKSEALGLRWSAIDFEQNTIRINYTVVKSKSIVCKATTKTQESRRTFELLPKVKEVLLRIKAEEEQNRDLFGSAYKENDFVFKWPDGTPYRPDGILRSFQRALKRHGLKPMGYHDLRRSTASILYEMGWDISEAKDWLGHADIATTSNIYTRISHVKKVALAKDLEGMFKLSGTEENP